MPLRDVIAPHPRILFVGINPSLGSEALGHHFAGPGNPFWRLLYAARLVPEPLTFAEDARLAEFELALTNLCSRATRAASDLRPAEMKAGLRVLDTKIQQLEPTVVAFVGITLYQYCFGLAASGGAGAKRETIHGARVFALPNPSGLNASFPGFADKLVWFKRLGSFESRVRKRRA